MTILDKTLLPWRLLWLAPFLLIYCIAFLVLCLICLAAFRPSQAEELAEQFFG